MIVALLFAIVAPMGAVVFVTRPAGTRATPGEVVLTVFSGVTWYGAAAMTFMSLRAGFVGALLATLVVSIAVWWPATLTRSGRVTRV